MTDSDLVELAFVLTHGNIMTVPTTRKLASESIRMWYNSRAILNDNEELLARAEEAMPGADHKEHARKFLNGTVNYTLHPDHGGYTYWAMAWSSVAGICIRERVETPQDRLVKAYEKHLNAGEEWKKGPEEEDE
jgi:hypothetical protein